MNNAGIVNGGISWELALDEWHRVLDTNLWGVIHGVRSFVPLILATREEGHVVNTASMAAVLPRDGLGPYTVAKHGVLGLTDVLRAELEALGAPVGVSVVMPGMIRTGMNPVGTVAASVVAANVVDAMRRRRPYVFTDDHHTQEVEDRLRAILAARRRGGRRLTSDARTGRPPVTTFRRVGRVRAGRRGARLAAHAIPTGGTAVRCRRRAGS